MTHSNSTKLLVIDDDKAVLRVLVKILFKYGYDADTAETGTEGMRKIESVKYDLVLTDIKMPGISGTEVANEIKQIKGNRFPVIGISGTPWLGKNTLLDEVLIKPFFIKELMNMIKKYHPVPDKTLLKKE